MQRMHQLYQFHGPKLQWPSISLNRSYEGLGHGKTGLVHEFTCDGIEGVYWLACRRLAWAIALTALYRRVISRAIPDRDDIDAGDERNKVGQADYFRAQRTADERERCRSAQQGSVSGCSSRSVVLVETWCLHFLNSQTMSTHSILMLSREHGYHLGGKTTPNEYGVQEARPPSPTSFYWFRTFYPKETTDQDVLSVLIYMPPP